MCKPLAVRGVEIGANQPKIVVSVAEKCYKDVLEKAEVLREMRIKSKKRIDHEMWIDREKQIDIVEWRADFYEDIFNIDRTINLLSDLRIILKDIPLLFTFRTKEEGGVRQISMEDYTELNVFAAKSGKVDFVDVEMFSGDDVVAKNIKALHEAGVFVIGSHHDFQSTPPKDVLVDRLRRMQSMGADILKIAVMPNSMEDVLTLLAATHEMYETYADRPIVTISMSRKGLISRISGEVFGSAMTFGVVGQPSAPGQIPVMDLAQVLNLLHRFSSVNGQGRS